MNRPLLSGVLAGFGLAALAATSVLASDMPPSRYLPPPRAAAYVPFFTWNGFYVGVNGGYGFGKSRWTDSTTGVSTGNFDVSGAVLGGTMGYNMQFGSTIFGVETDIDWSNIKGSTTTNCATTCQTSNNWLGTLRGRLGYTFDRLLPFVSAGLAYGNIKADLTGGTSFNDFKVGWTAGGGLEYAFAGNWTAKAEYLYVDLGKANCDVVCFSTAPFDATFQTHILRGGLNYKF